MKRHRSIISLGVMIGLIITLAGCVPPVPPASSPPIPPPCGGEVEIPVESTEVPKQIPIPNPEVVLLIATATPRGCYVGVTIDGTDQFGRHGLNYSTGRPYPWQGIRREPYTHRIWFDPRVELEVSIEVFAHGEDGDVRGCRIEYRGQVLHANVEEQNPARPQSFTLCHARVRGPQVPIVGPTVTPR